MRSSAEIKIELDEARAARSTALKAQAYSLDDGQGKQQVQRASLSEITKLIKILESEYQNAVDAESGDYGVTAGSFARY